MTKSKLKIGIVGCGAVAYRWYLKGLSNKNNSYSLEVVCDIDAKKAEKAAKDFNIANWRTDFKSLLNFNLDLVVILTRHDAHYKHIKFFLDNSVNVYSEKPFAADTQQGKKLLALAKAKKMVMGSAPQVMLSSRNIKTKQLIDAGKIGKITLVRASCSNLGPAGRADTNYDPEWFYQEGGSLSSLGIYGLSALTWLMGEPKVISCFEGISYPKRKVLFGPAKGKKFTVTAPDNVVAMFDYGNGTYALFDGSYSVATPPAYDFEIHGTKGSLLVGGFGGKESIVLKLIGKDPVLVGPEDDCHINWNLAWGVEDMVLAIREKRDPKASARFALKVINLMELMALSADRQKQVTVKSLKI